MRILLTLLAVAALAIVLFLPKDIMAAEAVPLDTFQSTCLTTQLSDCKVATAGYANSADGKYRIAWQTQTGFTAADGVLGGVVLLQPEGDGWTVFASAYDAFRYAPPRLIESGLLHVPGRAPGSGSPNADLLFAWDGSGTAMDWTPVDITAWKQTIDPMTGVMLYKGVDYDFENMTGRALFEVDKNAYGGPANGTVVMTFALKGSVLTYQYMRTVD